MSHYDPVDRPSRRDPVDRLLDFDNNNRQPYDHIFNRLPPVVAKPATLHHPNQASEDDLKPATGDGR